MRERVATEEERVGVCARREYFLMTDHGGHHGKLSGRERKLRASVSRVEEMPP